MDLEILFKSATFFAMAGWAALLAAPFAPQFADRFAGRLVPLVLSIGYGALLLQHWPTAEGDFRSLDGLTRLFTNQGLVLAGWLHYLAFDLVVGAWQVRMARRESLPHLWVIPCLGLTFVFGPLGFAAFLTLRTLRSGRRSWTA